MPNYIKKMRPSTVILVTDLIIMLLIPAQVRERTHTGVTTRFMPHAVTILIAVCAAADIERIFIREHHNKETGAVYFDKKGLLRVLASMAGVFAYLLLIPVIGFVLSSILLCAFVMVLMGNRQVRQIILASVLLSITVYCIFKLGLKLRLPAGLFFF